MAPYDTVLPTPDMSDHPQVRQRRRKRYWDLQRLGYKSYGAYLKSPHWRGLRATYWEAAATGEVPATCFCGEADGLQLHHVTYERIGREELTDLVPLCDRCHHDVHVLNRRGDLDLDLQGLENSTQAVLYQVQTVGIKTRAANENVDQAVRHAERQSALWRAKREKRRARQRANRSM